MRIVNFREKLENLVLETLVFFTLKTESLLFNTYFCFIQQKIQTNDDILDIEVQTDEIETTTKWTQCPSEDSKGWGIGNNHQ